jgi:hypothetical protein
VPKARLDDGYSRLELEDRRQAATTTGYARPGKWPPKIPPDSGLLTAPQANSQPFATHHRAQITPIRRNHNPRVGGSSPSSGIPVLARPKLVLRLVLRSGGVGVVREHWRGPDTSLNAVLRLAGYRAAAA